VTLDKVVLFVDSTQLTQGATAYVSADAEIHPYEAFLDYLKTLSGSLELNETSVRPSGIPPTRFADDVPRKSSLATKPVSLLQRPLAQDVTQLSDPSSPTSKPSRMRLNWKASARATLEMAPR